MLWGYSPSEISLSTQAGSNSVVIANSDIAGGFEGIQGNLGDSVAWLSGNINTDPMFVDAGAGNFHLAHGSPCIDSGTSFFEWDGETITDMRPGEYLGPAPDMGALEYEAVVSSEASGSLPDKVVLGQNYPNPFNP